MKIGDWIKRPGALRRHVDDAGNERWTGPRWHLVDSTIEDRVVTRCGREMHRQNRSGGELQVSDVMPLTRMIGQPQLCKAGCDRPDSTVTASGFDLTPSEPFVAVEDDANTSPVDPT